MLKSFVRRTEDNVSLKSSVLPFGLYCLYLISFFLQLPSRLPFLGVIRFDLLLVCVISFLIFADKSTKGIRLDNASKYIVSILLYSVIVLPFVEWPGSVISSGLYNFIKGAIFYFFTVTLIISEFRLKIILAVFIACNVFRILEPLFLNLTTGYLGSDTYLGGGEFAGRLAGAPHDIINANGLAFVIASVFPFLHYVFAPVNKKSLFCYVILIPVMLYTMGLTLSRSGVLALGIIGFGVFWKSKRKPALILVGVTSLLIIWSLLNDVQKDRYLSLVSDDAKQSSTAEARVEGWLVDFKVAMNRPIIGHGLGTSREANWNVAGKDQISHILWAEVVQEIGLIGLILFLAYLRVMIRNFLVAGRYIKKKLPEKHFLHRCTEAMQVWLLMNLLFSFASYGLNSYEWYFFGGLSVVLLKIVSEKLENEVTFGAKPSKNEGQGRLPRFPLAEKLNKR